MAIRFPNDNLVEKLMKRQDAFWRKREKERTQERDLRLGIKSQVMKVKTRGT